MTANYVTHKDLADQIARLEKDAKDDRHDLKDYTVAEISRVESKIDSHETTNALLKQSASHMQNDITEIKDLIKEMKKDLHSQFATKLEVKQNSEKINSVVKILWFI